jgi:hypothetical protein
LREASGNIWDMNGDALCITTNGYIKKDGTNVMGRGIAKEATKRYPGVEKVYGEQLTHYGLKVSTLVIDYVRGQRIVAFPVKHNWFEKADVALIAKSAKQLMEYADRNDLYNILLPRPGCGNGGLDWFTVKNIIEPILDDRVIAVTF